MEYVMNILMVFIGVASGVVVSAGVFAFINAMGIVPRFAVKSKTKDYLRVYEDAITLGGISGAIISFFSGEILLPTFLIGIYALAIGMFMGVLAVALAEVLNVVPILMRRFKLKMGISYMMLSIALGKSFGSIIYFFIEGFFEP